MREIPNLEEWAQVNEKGERNTYYGQYFRWMPCVTCDEWVEYLKKVCTIALTEGGFDGIMFDNVFAFPCYCPRCERTFNEYVRTLPDPVVRFGFDDLSRVRQPWTPQKAGDVRDPLVQTWYRWRTRRMTEVLMRLRAHIKRVKPDAVVSGNPHPYRYSPAELAPARSLDMLKIDEAFDLIIMQSANFPECTKDGRIRNRVRELKMAQCRGKTLVALCDSDAMVTEQRERNYLLPLMEDASFGGVPTDRTIVSPKREPGFVSHVMIERRKPQLAAFNKLLADKRAAFAGKPYTPVKIFYPADNLMFSEASHLAIAAAEEILLRNQIPWGYVLSRADRVFAAPADCEVLVVPGIASLSDREIEGLLAYAKKGGRMVVTGEAGRYDDWNAERFTSPLMDALKAKPSDYPHTVLRDEPDLLPVAKIAWQSNLAAPKDGGKALLADIAKTGWRPAIRIEGAPAHVFVEVKKTADGFAVHFVNYNPDVPVAGVKVQAGDVRQALCTIPFDPQKGELGVTSSGGCALPSFSKYALVEVR